MPDIRYRRRWRRILADTRLLYVQRFTRKPARLLRRLSTILFAILVLFSIWNYRQPDEKRYVHKDALSREAWRNTFQRRLVTPRQTDPRIWPGWPGVKAIFAFGDSYTDTGFNPHGPQPDNENPLGNPAWPGRTANYGPNYLGHLSVSFRDSPVKIFNFANKGSPFESGIAGEDQITPLSLSQQIDTKFLRRYGTSSKMWESSTIGWGDWYQADSLFVMYAGTDDLLFSFAGRQGGQDEARARQHMEEYERSVEKLYNAGARNFLFINYPSLGESPFARNLDIPRTYLDLGADIVHHNGRLAFMAHRFAEHHMDANIFVFDQHKMSLAIRRDRTQFPETARIAHIEGFCFPYAEESLRGDTEDIYDDLCGSTLDTWLWRDDRHNTEPYNRLMARLIVDLLADPKQRLPMEFY